MEGLRRVVILTLTGILGCIVIKSILRLNAKQTSTSSSHKDDTIHLPSITICFTPGNPWANKTIEKIHDDTNLMSKHFKSSVITIEKDFKTNK